MEENRTNPNPAEPAAAPIRLLIVDNDEALARAMEESLAKVGYECVVATSGPEGARRIDTDSFDLVVTDLVMNDVDGMEILARSREKLPDAEVVLVTGHATVPKAVEAMQQGAFNFLEKPITTSRLRAVCEKAADAIRLKRQNVELRERLDERFGFEGIIYASSQMQGVIDRLKRIAPTDATVLIHGESGTGKELIAQAIHQNSPAKGSGSSPSTAPRSRKTWSKANCSAMSKAPLPMPTPTGPARSSSPMAARCFSMKSATCR